jgi:5,5'-dehydrodivanillate O-demethylase oxygenase subunit
MTTSSRDGRVNDANDVVELTQTGPETIAGRYLRRFWLPVAEVGDVAPGRAKAIQILGQQFTLFRGVTGDPHLVDYFCAHRSSPLFTGHVEGDCIRCFYHGWLYDAAGQCVEQPAEDAAFADKVRIEGYPVRVYQGLVFAYLGNEVPPPFQTLARFSAPGFNGTSSYVRKTNYLNSLENSVDYTHPFFVHKNSEFTGVGVNREIPRVAAVETDYGIAGKKLYSDGKAQINHILMPLSALIVNVEGETTFDHLAWRIPIADNSHRTFILNHAELFGDELEHFQAARARRSEMLKKLEPQLAVVDAIFRGEVYVDDVDLSRPDIISIQDCVAMELQPPIGQRRPDRLGRGDLAIILLRRLLRREFQALETGRPLKDWRWPGDLCAQLNVAQEENA